MLKYLELSREFLIFVSSMFKTTIMKSKDLIKILQENPEADVIFWDGEDNHDIDEAYLDDINGIEVVLSVSYIVKEKS
jgi:hypothetical protein